MVQGAGILHQWLVDLIRHGIQNLSTAKPDYWENLASLLVDHKLGSLARRIRRFAPIIQEQEDWFELILAEIGQLFLISQGLSRLDQFSLPIQAEILAQAGKSYTKKEILATEPTGQAFLVLGHSFGKEEQLAFRKTWYWAEKDARFIQELEFIVGRQQSFSKSLPIGLCATGKVYYYPSTLPSRVLISDSTPASECNLPPTLTDFSEMQKLFAQALGKNPWLIDFPCRLQNIQIQLQRNEILLIDSKNQVQEITYHPQTSNILALYAAKQTVSIFGTWNGQKFQAISLLEQDFVVDLNPTIEKPPRQKYWA